MIAVFAALAAVLAGPQNGVPETAWTWTLYADGSPVVLANEVPDTANLRATLECEPGGGVARLTLYGGAPLSGMARLSAGESTAVAEAEAARGGGGRLSIQTDHPAFAAFGAEGQLAVAAGDQRRTVEVPASHLAKLRRFAELCSG